MLDPPGCSVITLKKTPEVIPFLWASSTLCVSGFSSFILMENWLQVSCSPFKAKFLKAFSQFDSIKYFRMQSARQPVCSVLKPDAAGCPCPGNVVGKLLQKQHRKGLPKKKGWRAAIILQTACYRWSNCFAWEGQTPCMSSAVVRLCFSSAGVWGATGRNFLVGAPGSVLYGIPLHATAMCWQLDSRCWKRQVFAFALAQRDPWRPCRPFQHCLHGADSSVLGRSVCYAGAHQWGSHRGKALLFF